MERAAERIRESFMRFAIAAAAAALMLAACGQSGAPSASAPGANPLESAFPNIFQTAYRAQGFYRDEESGARGDLVMTRSGRNYRLEFQRDGQNVAIITNADAQEAYLVSQMGGRQMAMRMPVDAEQAQDPFADWSQGGQATQRGPCLVAGQAGVEWVATPEEGQTTPETACVTPDGIILKATENGETTWEVTSVQRGPQDAALFAVPAGAQIVDLGAMAGAMQNAIAAQKAQ